MIVYYKINIATKVKLIGKTNTSVKNPKTYNPKEHNLKELDDFDEWVSKQKIELRATNQDGELIGPQTEYFQRSNKNLNSLTICPPY